MSDVTFLPITHSWKWALLALPGTLATVHLPAGFGLHRVGERGLDHCWVPGRPCLCPARGRSSEGYPDGQLCSRNAWASGTAALRPFWMGCQEVTSPAGPTGGVGTFPDEGDSRPHWCYTGCHSCGSSNKPQAHSMVRRKLPLKLLPASCAD